VYLSGAWGQTVSGTVYPHVLRVKGSLKADLLIGVTWSQRGEKSLT